MDKQIKDIQLCSNDTILEFIKQQKETMNSYKKIITTLIASICIIIFTLCGTAIYAINTIDVTAETTTTTTQTVDGEGEIINGNQYKDNATHNQTKEGDK